MNLAAATTPQITVAVVGLGLLGRGIATCLLGHGFQVVGCDQDADAYNVATEYIGRGLHDMVYRAGFDRSVCRNWLSRFQAVSNITDWPTVDFVVESIDEDVLAKQGVFDQIERVVARDVPIASNTSAIPITTLQASRKHPTRFIGMHWFEPAHATRFLELIPGDHTSRATMQAAINIAKRCGKDPSVLAKDIPGFIVNRLAYALYREAANLLELGVADVETIDRSFRNACGVWSTIFGPFQWMDLTGGPELYAKAMQHVLPTLSNQTEVPEAFRRLIADRTQGAAMRHGFTRCTSAESAEADQLFHSHAWEAAALLDKYYPLREAI